jgi:hypothetical protein
VFEVLGVPGSVISVAAYVPPGGSPRPRALLRGDQQPRLGDVAGERSAHRTTSDASEDPVFILLQVNTLTSAAMILVLAWRYQEWCSQPTRTWLRPVRR